MCMRVPFSVRSDHSDDEDSIEVLFTFGSLLSLLFIHTALTTERLSHMHISRTYEANEVLGVVKWYREP